MKNLKDFLKLLVVLALLAGACACGTATPAVADDDAENSDAVDAAPQLDAADATMTKDFVTLPEGEGDVAQSEDWAVAEVNTSDVVATFDGPDAQAAGDALPDVDAAAPDDATLPDDSVVLADVQSEVQCCAEVDAVAADTSEVAQPIDGGPADSGVPDAGLPAGCTDNVCDDGNECTSDSCDALNNCLNKFNVLPCSDGDGCTVGETCKNGLCLGGSPNKCDDGQPCTADLCLIKTGLCSNTPIPTCDCSSGKSCDDGQSCTTDTCTAEKTCTHVQLANGTFCDDANACTNIDLCSAGKCGGQPKIDCDDGSKCTDAICDPKTGKCLFFDKSASCDDKDPCTADACVIGKGCMHYGKFFDNNYEGFVNDLINAVIVLPDGLAFTGRNSSTGPGYNNYWLVKTDFLGKTVFDKVYGGPKDDVANALAVVDGGFAVVGSTLSKGAGAKDFWIVRTDKDGTALWDKVFGGVSDDQANGVVEQNDGIAIAGMTQSKGAGGKDAWLIRTDKDGNLLWDKTYGGSGADEALAVSAMADGFALAGTNGSKGAGGADFWLIRTDAAGTVLWDKTYGGKSSDQCRAMVATADGFALTGPTSSKGAGSYDYWLVRTDLNGVALWDKTYGTKNDEQTFAVAALPDGFVISGRSLSKAINKDYVYVVRTDLWGNQIWQRNYGDGTGEGRGVQGLPDGLIITGYSSTPGQVKAAGKLFRTDAWGHVNCPDAGVCFGKIVSDCDDGNACTADVCDNVKGCVSVNFSDGAACGDGKGCKAGACL